MSYREFLRPNTGAFLAIALIGPATWLVASPLSPDFAILIALFVLVTALSIAFFAVPRIEVGGDVLKAGRIEIGLKHLGEAKIFCGTERQQSMGVELDARAVLCTSPWIDCVVKVEVKDQNDPVPYLIISTRKPVDLVAALQDSQRDTHN